MDNKIMTTKKALLVVGILVFLFCLTLFVPARYVGMTNNERPLILKTDSELTILSGDEDGNNVPDWRDLALESIQTTPTDTSLSPASQEEETLAEKRLTDPDNLTASFSKNLYVASVYANKEEVFTEEDQDALSQSLLDQEKNRITVTTYTTNDLTFTKKEDPSTQKEYGNALGLLFKKAEKLKVGTNDLVIIQAFNVNQDESILETLVIKKNNLTSIINDLLAMKVPYSALPYHLFMINKLSHYKTTLDNLSKAKDDPLRASLAFKEYPQVVRAVVSSMESIQNYFLVQNISFVLDEPGYILTPGYTEN